MCPARLSAQGPSAASRWSDEEHDILVDLTNEQLELEKKDASKVIPWAKHWINVSDRLHKKGYSRTAAACLGYWKRTVGAQKANEKAAGPRWEDAEHQILLGMTEDQLVLEETDPTAVMSWAKHWKKVSERLKESGYTRSIDACDAYWNLVQDKSPLAAGAGVDDDDDSLTPEGPFEVNCEVEANENENEDEKQALEKEAERTPEPPTKIDAESPIITEPRRTPRRVAEKDPETIPNEDIEITSPTQSIRTPRGRPRKDSTLPTKLEKESMSPNQPNRTSKKSDSESASPALVEKIKAMIEELGYTPKVNDLPRKYAITKWAYLRWHKEQEVEEVEPEPEVAPEPKVAPEPEVEPEREPEPEKPQEEPEQQEKVEIRPSPQPSGWSSVNSPRPAPMPSKSPSVEAQAASFKSEAPQRTALPEENLNVSPAPSNKKPRSTAFRFTPEQRAYLEEKVARTGSNPDVYSRIEMANELGVEEKTIRNWFINHRQKTNRRSLEDRPREDFPSYANEYSRAPNALKRAQGSVDGNELVEITARGKADSPGYGHQHKKPRLEEELRPNMADQPPIVSPPISEPINIIRKIAPREPEETAPPPPPPHPPASQPPPLPPNRGPEVPPPKQSVNWVQDGPPPPPKQAFNWVLDGPPPPPRVGPLHQGRAMHESPYGAPPSAPPRHSMHPEPSHHHSHSGSRPPPPPPTHILESQSFQPVNKPPAEYEASTPSSWAAKPSVSGSSQSQYSNDTKPSSATPQPMENDKAWAARRVPEIQGQISVLNRDSDSRIGVISKLEQELEAVKRQSNSLEMSKQSEIARVIAEIERKYERDYEMLRESERRLVGSREEEMEMLRRNARQVAKCEKKMSSYMALVDLDNDSEGSS